MADSTEMVWFSLIHACKYTMSAVSPVEIAECLNWWDWCLTKQRNDFPLVVHLFGGWYLALGNTYIPTERHKWLARSSLVCPKGVYGAWLIKESITRSSTVQKSLGLSWVLGEGFTLVPNWFVPSRHCPYLTRPAFVACSHWQPGNKRIWDLEEENAWVALPASTGLISY